MHKFMIALTMALLMALVAPMAPSQGVTSDTKTPETTYTVTSVGQEVLLDPKTMKSIPNTVTTFDEWSGGTSSAKGCKRTSVLNYIRNALGSLAVKLRVWDEWCWNRHNRNVNYVKGGKVIEFIGAFQVYRKRISRDLRHYDWTRTGNWPRSGLFDYRNYQFQNCVLYYGCILGYEYMRESMWMHSNGTWRWGTNGDSFS